MARKADKTRIVAFKVDHELAEFLDKLENKSEFIRKAILAQFNMNCPLCSGSGVVTRGLHDHFTPVLNQHNHRNCANCGHQQPLPRDLNTALEEDKPRFEQFMHGGPLLCAACYADAPACGQCEWRLTEDSVASHKQHAHPE